MHIIVLIILLTRLSEREVCHLFSLQKRKRGNFGARALGRGLWGKQAGALETREYHGFWRAGRGKC